MLRKLFGQRTLLASVYEPRKQRMEDLCRKIASSKNSADPEAHKDCGKMAATRSEVIRPAELSLAKLRCIVSLEQGSSVSAKGTSAGTPHLRSLN